MFYVVMLMDGWMDGRVMIKRCYVVHVNCTRRCLLPDFGDI